MSGLRAEFDRLLEITIEDVAVARTCLKEGTLPSSYTNVMDVDLRVLLDKAKEVTEEDPADLGQAHDDAKAVLDLVAEIPDDRYLELALSHSDELRRIGNTPLPVFDDFDI